MINRKNLSLLLIMVIIISGCHFPGEPWVLVEITSHEDEQSILLNEETFIIAQARSSQGIEKVELYINGELEYVDQPPLGTPREHIAELPIFPLIEEPIIISVLAVDRVGTVSDPFSITLQVTPSMDDIDTETTPTPTVSPEEMAQTQTAQAGCVNSASFVEHVTIPINTSVSANTNFTKIWRVNNDGTCDWTGYQVVHSSGDLMNATSPKALPVVNAGSNADIIIDMAAPATPGTYNTVWRIQAGDGTLFGPELTVAINVLELPTDTPVPTATPTQTPSPTATQTPTATSIPISVNQLSDEISIPPNSSESKTVTCPQGSVVVSGGFSHQAGVRVWQSLMDGNGWRISATNTHTAARSLTVTATCLANTNGTSTSISEQRSATPNDFTQLTATCPSGAIVTGGGWAIGSNTDLTVYHSSISGNGWRININNPQSSAPMVNIYAICLSGVSGSTSQKEKTENTVPPNSTANAKMNCPSGSFVTAGGFSMDWDLMIYNTTKEGNGWINYVSNPTGAEKRLDTYAICYQP